MIGRRAKAIQIFARGLEEEPKHGELKAALREADRRSTPVIAFLDRNHPLNVYLGKARARRRRAALGAAVLRRLRSSSSTLPDLHSKGMRSLVAASLLTLSVRRGRDRRARPERRRRAPAAPS